MAEPCGPVVVKIQPPPRCSRRQRRASVRCRVPLAASSAAAYTYGRQRFLNAPGILIHGTPEDASIGHWASHGCVRMHEADVLGLYPLVPVGTKVIIYGAPPWGASAVAGSSAGF
jgi:lipoprotein-anchoring transpeptidase ErfK/SrfK